MVIAYCVMCAILVWVLYGVWTMARDAREIRAVIAKAKGEANEH